MSSEFDGAAKWTEVEDKQIACVQSILHRGGDLVGFTIRFTDGSLMKVDVAGSALDVKIVEAGSYY